MYNCGYSPALWQDSVIRDSPPSHKHCMDPLRAMSLKPFPSYLRSWRTTQWSDCPRTGMQSAWVSGATRHGSVSPVSSKLSCALEYLKKLFIWLQSYPKNIFIWFLHRTVFCKIFLFLYVCRYNFFWLFLPLLWYSFQPHIFWSVSRTADLTCWNLCRSDVLVVFHVFPVPFLQCTVPCISCKSDSTQRCLSCMLSGYGLRKFCLWRWSVLCCWTCLVYRCYIVYLHTWWSQLVWV